MHRILEEIPLFDGIKQNVLRTISPYFTLKKYKQNRMILTEGSDNNHFYIIKKGGVRVYRKNKSDQKVILALLQEGDFFGEMSILDDNPASAYVSTTQPSEILCINQRNFYQMLKKAPGIAQRLFAYMSQRIRNCDQCIENLKKSNTYERVGNVLIQLAEKSGYRKRTSVIIDKIPFQHQIASLAGTSRETVSRTFAQLEENEYIIKDKRHLVINDYPRFYKEFT